MTYLIPEAAPLTVYLDKFFKLSQEKKGDCFEDFLAVPVDYIRT